MPEDSSQSLDPDRETMRRLGHATADRVADWLADLSNQRVFTPPEGPPLRALVDEPLPRQGLGEDSSLARFFDELLPKATLVNHPRFFAYVPGPGSFQGALGGFMASATNLFVGTWLGGASMAALEERVLMWLAEAIDLPGATDGAWQGVITSGGSMANLTALAAAAEAKQPALDVAEGRSPRNRLTVYVSSEAHHSLAKAAGILGFDRGAVRHIETDLCGRMQMEALTRAVAIDRAAGRVPCCVAATAGTTNTGAVDPLPEIAAFCAREDLWLHVDGAYGAAAALTREGRAILHGFDRADSITLDPHKWFYAPFEAGVFLTRHIDCVERAFATGAGGQYMQDVPLNETNFHTRGAELTRGNRALPLWMLLRSVGIDAIAAAVARDIEHARHAAALLAEDERLHIVTEPRLSIFTFAVRPIASETTEAGSTDDDMTRKLMAAIHNDGMCMLSSTLVQDRFVLRFCVANHRTQRASIEATVERVLSLLRRMG